MKLDSQMRRQRTSTTEPSLRRSTRVGSRVVGVATVVVLLAVLWSSQAPNRVAQTRAESDLKDQQEAASADQVTPQPPGNTASYSSVAFSASALTSESVAQDEPTPETRQLVDSLVRLRPQEGLLTDEFAK